VGVYAKKLIEALKAYNSKHSFSFFDSTSEAVPNADILHYPFFDPFFLTLPLLSPKCTVVTVHDLIPLTYPEHFKRGFRGTIKWMMQKYSLERKQGIITDSISSKNDIVHVTRFEEDRVFVVPLAPSLEVIKEGEDQKISERSQKDFVNYFLAVGDVNWNKNIPGLLKAFAQVKKTESEPLKLILVGKAYLQEELPEVREIYSIIHALGIKNEVQMTGYIPDHVLIQTYKNALALIAPSYAEGFGFTVLDAMAIGCPVVCANASSLKEIAGPSLLVDPYSADSIAQAMIRIIHMNSLDRRKQIKEGRTWSNQFTWREVAKKTIDAYEKILEQK